MELAGTQPQQPVAADIEGGKKGCYVNLLVVDVFLAFLVPVPGN